MKKIIVTGGLGFIGSNLIDLLIKKNFSVINIDKISYSSNFYNCKEYNNSNKYKFIRCNISEKKFKKIKLFYTEGPSPKELNLYDTLNVMFNDQIVCSKIN